MKKTMGFLSFFFFITFGGAAFGEYIDNEDGTITDSRTNLMWQQTNAGYINWDNASSYCAQSGTGGYGDWRLPTLTELQLLLNPEYEPMIDPIFITVTSPSWYWTSSADNDSFWCVSFYIGSTQLRDRSQANYQYVRCVRGAQTPSPCSCIQVGDDLSITIPCVEYQGTQYELKLKYYYDPTLPSGLYWKALYANPK